MRGSWIALSILLTACSGGRSSGNPSGSGSSSACYSSVCIEVVAIDAQSYGYRNPTGSVNKEQYRLPQNAINLNELDPSTKISKGFVLNDIMRSKDGDIGIFSPEVLNKLEAIREDAKKEVVVTSGYRTPIKNKAVGGSTFSRHLYGDAIDIYIPGITPKNVEKLCKKYGATWTDVYSDGHVHCDWRGISVSSLFFGTPLLAQDHKGIAENTLKEVYDSSYIVVDGNIQAGATIILSSVMEEQEDPGSLLKTWIVYLPDGSQYKQTAQEVKLSLVPGAYQVIHYLGSNIVLNKSFVVK